MFLVNCLILVSYIQLFSRFKDLEFHVLTNYIFVTYIVSCFLAPFMQRFSLIKYEMYMYILREVYKLDLIIFNNKTIGHLY